MASFRSLLRPFRRKSANFSPQIHSAATLLRLPPLLSLFSPPSPTSVVPTFLNPSISVLRFTSSGSRFFSPLWIPLSGPLLLLSPNWKLSQTATPLYLQEDAKNGRLRLRSSGNGPARLAIYPIDSARVKAVVGGERVLNLPNLISISRLISGPVIGWMIMSEWYLPSFVGLGISGLTDWLDGYVARKMRINSVIGSYLDPLADKVLIGCVAIAMVKKDLLHAGLVGLIVFRDVGLVSGAIYKRASIIGWKWKILSDFSSLDKIRPERVEPLFISKVNTVFQLALIASALLQPDFGSELTQLYINYLSWLVASTTVASSMGYGVKLFWPRK